MARRLRSNKRGQILILMATTLMAILLVTTLASVRTFKPIHKDPEATIMLIRSQTRRVVMNGLAAASLTGDTDTDRFGQNLQLQFRNIAVGRTGLSLSVSDVHSVLFDWGGQTGRTAASVTLQMVELQYKLDCSESISLDLQLRIDDLAKRPYEQFEELQMNVTVTMNGGPSLIRTASVTTAQTHLCRVIRNYGNGKYCLLVMVPQWDPDSPPFELNIMDENNIRVACTFDPPT